MELQVHGWLGKRIEKNFRNRLMNREFAHGYLDYYENPVETVRWFRGEHIIWRGLVFYDGVTS